MDTPQLSSLYQQLILEHNKKPRNKGELEEHTAEIHMRNPTCGDEVKLQLRVEEGVVADVGFTGQGCSISQAAISMMTQQLRGASITEALELAQRFTRDRSLGDLRALKGVSKFPVRVKCALLGFDALQEALKVEVADAEESRP